MEEIAGLSEFPAQEGWPVLPKDTILFFAHFAAREIEATLRKRCQIMLTAGEADSCGTVTLSLPTSKTDPQGAGALRKHGCCCAAAKAMCPVAAARRIMEDGSARGLGMEDPFVLAMGSSKSPPTKKAMVDAFREAAKRLGWPEADVLQVTGHTLRPTGAIYLARTLPIFKVQLFCRWGSDVVLQYLRELPLDESEGWASQAASYTLREVEEEATLVAKSRITKETWNQDACVELMHKLLDAKMQQLSVEWLQEKECVMDLLQQLKEGQELAFDAWEKELSRNFLPRFVLNVTTGKLHVVKDTEHTACGVNWRQLDYRLTRNSSGDRCDRSGCCKAFEC